MSHSGSDKVTQHNEDMPYLHEHFQTKEVDSEAYRLLKRIEKNTRNAAWNTGWCALLLLIFMVIWTVLSYLSFLTAMQYA